MEMTYRKPDRAEYKEGRGRRREGEKTKKMMVEEATER